MKNDAPLATNAGDLFNWLNRSDFIIGVHHRYEKCLRTDRTANIVRIDPAKSIHANQGHGSAESFNEPARFEHGRMFN